MGDRGAVGPEQMHHHRVDPRAGTAADHAPRTDRAPDVDGVGTGRLRAPGHDRRVTWKPPPATGFSEDNGWGATVCMSPVGGLVRVCSNAHRVPSSLDRRRGPARPPPARAPSTLTEIAKGAGLPGAAGVTLGVWRSSRRTGGSPAARRCGRRDGEQRRRRWPAPPQARKRTRRNNTEQR